MTSNTIRSTLTLAIPLLGLVASIALAGSRSVADAGLQVCHNPAQSASFTGLKTSVRKLKQVKPHVYDLEPGDAWTELRPENKEGMFYRGLAASTYSVSAPIPVTVAGFVQLAPPQGEDCVSSNWVQPPPLRITGVAERVREYGDKVAEQAYDTGVAETGTGVSGVLLSRGGAATLVRGFAVGMQDLEISIPDNAGAVRIGDNGTLFVSAGRLTGGNQLTVDAGFEVVKRPDGTFDLTPITGRKIVLQPEPLPAKSK